MHGALSPSELDEKLATLRQRETSGRHSTQLAFIEALARRAIHHHGQAQRLILSRLHRLISDYEQALAQSAFGTTPQSAPTNPPRSALSTLVDELDRRGASDSAPHNEPHSALHSAPQSAEAAPSREPVRELKTLQRFRSTWSALHAQQKLQHALARAPRQAGPLNSHQLVHRCLTLMQEASPVYLQHLISTIEALSWASQLQLGPTTVETPSRPRGVRGKAVR